MNVHDIKPPFLDGKTQYTKQLEPIKIVKDEASTMAILSKKGSQVIRGLRERKDKQQMRDRYPPP